MQRSRYEVTGLGRTHSHFSRFGVPDFPYQHHIRVLPQEAPNGGGKGHAGLLVHGHLANQGHVVFDGILHRHDVVFKHIDAAQCGIQRGGLAAAGWPCDQDNTVRRTEQLMDLLLVCLTKAQQPERQHIAPG